MASNRITTKLFSSQPQFQVNTLVPAKTPSPSPLSSSADASMQTNNSPQPDDDFHPGSSLIQSLSKVAKRHHLEQIVYLSKPPQTGILTIYTQKGHVFLQFKPYRNQLIQDNITGGFYVENLMEERPVEFCIEDTPTYESFEGSQDVQIQFVLGRKLTIEIYPFVMLKDTEYKFRMFLRNFGVTMKDGVIHCEKKRMQFEINIPEYLKELKENEYQIIKRENWKVTKGIYDVEMVDKSIEWNDDTEQEIRQRLFSVGITNEYRMDIWMKCLNVDLHREVYKKIKIQVENLVEIQIKNNSALRRDIEQIAKDIKRTTIQEHLTSLWNKSEGEIKDIMTSLLRMWIVFNIDTGYHQGMNEIILGLMECSTDEYHIFSTFVKLMEMMSKLLHGKVPFDSIITPIVRTVDPDLESYFSMMRIGYSFMYKWVILLFRRDFSQEHCIRLWDAIFAHPEDKFHFFIATAMLLQHRDLILQNRLDLDDMSIFFLGLENKFDINVLFEAAMQLEIFKEKATEEDKKIVFN